MGGPSTSTMAFTDELVSLGFQEVDAWRGIAFRKDRVCVWLLHVWKGEFFPHVQVMIYAAEGPMVQCNLKENRVFKGVDSLDNWEDTSEAMGFIRLHLGLLPEPLRPLRFERQEPV